MKKWIYKNIVGKIEVICIVILYRKGVVCKKDIL